VKKSFNQQRIVSGLLCLLVILGAIAGCGGRSGGGITASNLGNQAPVVSLSASKAVILSDGADSSTITATATDANGDAITYAWTTSGGTLTRVSDTQYTLTATAAGSYDVAVRATDANGATTVQTTTINSFGANATQGGVTGSFSVPRATFRAGEPTTSGNTLDAPLSIMEQGRDTSRAVAAKPAPTLCSRTEFAAGELIVGLQPGVTAASVAAAAGMTVKSGGRSSMALLSLDVSGLSRAEALAKTRTTCLNLNGKPGVAYADLNGINKTMATTPNDPRYADQWHYPLMNLPQAWDITTGSASVIVAVLDTGGVAGHTDLSGRLVQGYDFVSDATAGCDGDGIDNNPEDVADMRCTTGGITSQDPRHGGYHGLHVAGTIGAATNNGTGVSGVDWSAKIMPIRVLGAGGGTDYDIAQGMLYAAGLTNDSGTVPAQAAKIINMSLGGDPGESCSAAMNTTFQQVHNAGVAIFVAGGNEYSKTAINPTALCNHAIAVAAVDRGTKVAPYSNQGPGLTISAPGGSQDNVDSDGVLSTMRDNTVANTYTYKYYQGTSMATPHAAGVGALMLAANPNLTPAQMAEIMAQTATDLGTAGTDNVYGAGLLNAYKAVLEAKKLNTTVTEPATPVIALSTNKIYLNENTSTADIIITNTGGGTLTLTSVTDSETSGGNWMSTSTSSSSGKITLTITVTRAVLTSGAYTGTVRIVSNGGTATVDVTMQVNAPTPTAPTGCVDNTIYVLAVKTSDYDTAGQAEAAITATEYKMFEVPNGSYYIVAGTDCNGDDFICDQSTDLCGAYPLFNDPEPITVTAQQFSAQINFAITTVGGSAARVSGDSPEAVLPKSAFKIRRK